ncbi:transporter hol1 [Fusarium phyllophilum]|uniref:Transporter hol1 n=1 Tax=Fusarium phyllophilum TaxID=47803 RepID=A0A8H5JII3_9HYPO|nr:transporter hol1 [Fusarium phyllophilum]
MRSKSSTNRSSSNQPSGYGVHTKITGRGQNAEAPASQYAKWGVRDDEIELVTHIRVSHERLSPDDTRSASGKSAISTMPKAKDRNPRSSVRLNQILAHHRQLAASSVIVVVSIIGTITAPIHNVLVGTMLWIVLCNVAVVMTGMVNGYDIPARIELDLLVSYIVVVDKYKLGKQYLSQGFDWADALLPTMSTSFDEDAIAWLWVLWRLHMPAEFKKLSAIIAQQATGRIDPEHDRHGFEMPKYIVDAIEQRRVNALSQVRDCVYHVIEFCKDYTDHSWSTWDSEPQVISSNLTVKYLTLETQKHLSGVQEGHNPNFHGISFNDTAKWIHSMINLGDWMVRTMPPVSTGPGLLAYLSFSVLGVGLHEAEDSTGLSSHIHKRLTTLIDGLQDEEWGLDLDWLQRPIF